MRTPIIKFNVFNNHALYLENGTALRAGRAGISCFEAGIKEPQVLGMFPIHTQSASERIRKKISLTEKVKLLF